MKQLTGFEPQHNDFAPFVKPDQLAILDPNYEPTPGDDVYIELDNGDVDVGELIEATETTVRYTSYNGMVDQEKPVNEVKTFYLISGVKRQRTTKERPLRD